MTETVTEETQKPRRGRRPKSAPNAELAKRREDRKKRGAADYGFTKRLGLDESKLDPRNYAYRWVNDKPGRVSQLEAREWERVADDDIEGQEAARFAGLDPSLKPMHTVLMRKWRDWFEEDKTDQLKLHKENLSAMMGGQSADQRAPDSDGREYAVKTNRVETVTTAAQRNPDFE